MKRWLLRVGLGVALLGFLTVCGAIVALEVAGSSGEFPIERLRRPAASTRVLDRRGEVLRETLSAGGQRARWVRLGQVSLRFLQAIVAAEDGRFVEHRGVDWRAYARAAVSTLLGRRSGGSTITQQVVKLLSPGPRNLTRKWREAVLALRLERRVSKAEILEQYVNRAPFGPQVVGVEAGAQWLFHKAARELSVGEAALLAAMPKGPAFYNPYRHPRRALRRRAWVLARMEAMGFLDARARRLAAREPLALAGTPSPFAAPHFVARVLREAPAGTREIATTLDERLQRRAEALVRRAVDSVRGRGGSQAAAIVLDNHSGEVLAYVGSYDWADPREGRNDGVVALRQPGSALKPLAYGLAFERRLLSPASALRDLPTTFTTAVGEYSPGNYDGRFHGLVLAREALANSYNVPAVRVANRLEPGELLAFLRGAGFASLLLPEDHYGLGIVLGNGEVTLFELARAYLMLARGGELVEPALARGGARAAPRRVLSPQAAYLVTHILADRHARQAAFGERSALELPFPAAAKTGTSTDFRDNWTAGFTPEVTVAVWVGNFTGQPMHHVSGVSGAAPLFNELMRAAMEGRPRRGFVRPAGIVTAAICPRSGKLAGPHCAGHRREVFLAGRVPGETCDLHVEVEVDRRNGLLAGPGCPAAVRRTVRGERYPADLAGWAVATGRPLVPRRASPLCPGVAPGPTRAVSITSPRDGQVLSLVPDLPRRAQRLPLEAVVEGAPATLRWLVDGREVARAPFPYQGRWRLQPGEHTVQAVAGGIESPPIRVTVRD